MKDEYTTEEHLLLALINHWDTSTKNILTSSMITEDKVKEIITTMKNWEKVTDNNPENKMNA